MHSNSLAFAAYWRTALADAALGSGALTNEAVDAFVQRPLVEFEQGKLGADAVRELFKDEREDVQAIEVLLRPRMFILKVAHGQARRATRPQFVAPLLSGAMLSRAGRLYPVGRTVVPRDLLDPLDKPAFVIGTVDEQDEFLTMHPAPRMEPDEVADTAEVPDTQWQTYRRHCDHLLDTVAGRWIERHEGYLDAGFWCIARAAGATGAAVHILGLYDHLAEYRPDTHLFERYAADAPAARLPCLPPHAAFAARLGHASDRYPLAPAQRDSLSHLLSAAPGSITCVNGPPGTGKTTLLLSVVASLWAQAALEGGEPPLIITASTNNQAVTNVIDAFGRDFAQGTGPLAGRWLPLVSSFGAYFPAQKKEAEAAGKYQTRAFFEAVENTAFVVSAEAEYLARACVAFPDLGAATVDAVVARLQDGMRTIASRLARLEDLWHAREQACAAVRAVFGDAPEDVMYALREGVAAIDTDLKSAQLALEQWERYLAGEPVWLTLFAWLPPIARKRLRLAKQFWKSVCADEAEPSWTQPEEAEAAARAGIAHHAARAAGLREEIASNEALLAAQRQALEVWKAAVASHVAVDAADDLAAVDEALDTQLRFEMFRLATHYWEGRWLLDMKPLLPELGKKKPGKGRGAIEAQWRRRMKLTPCAVSTFFMLPSLFKAWRYEDDGFVPDYLYEFIDLLIVDEAGQVLPEVAGAAFALAKRALVIGDTMQIAPIWAVPRRIDAANLAEHGLLDPRDPVAFARIAASGRVASSGSVMRIAQHASHYHYDPDLSPGLYLYEHRRCYDDIIGYCNTLCYKGKLQPKRGARPADVEGLPAFGYLHIDGMCRRNPAGSAYNLLEARTIAAWLQAQRATLEQRYGKPLAEIVGIVTPFSAQVAAIAAACKQAGVQDENAQNGITIGTVHALQGAERPVVIFSPCYSKHLDGGFIDRDSSILNVAVSRAKDSFLVFGDMDVMETAVPGAPRRLLVECLLDADGGALQFDTGVRTDLADQSDGVSHLRDALEHDAFLLDALARAQREVRIMTPWIRARRIREPAVWKALQDAIGRGVAVHVYTDQEYNVGEGANAAVARNTQTLHGLLEALGRDGLRAATVRKVHSKIVTVDRTVYCVGSFNWFSASREEAYARHETSLVYRGPALQHEIEAVTDSLERRVMRRYPPAEPTGSDAPPP